MLGAIIGDMVGSIYEFHPLKSKDFDIYNSSMRLTDDSFLTIAVAKVLLQHLPIDYSVSGLEIIKNALIDEFVNTVNDYPEIGYGSMFYNWTRLVYYRDIKEPYNSFGNGSAMRISPVGWLANNEKEVKLLSKAVSEITHNHPEGLKGAESVAMCILMARQGKNKEQIRDFIIKNYYPEIENFSFDDLVKNYEFDESCQGSCPQAIFCFLISRDLEDAIRNCIAIGGDCDTTGAMAGAIAEAYYSRVCKSNFEINFANKMLSSDLVDFIDCFKAKTVDIYQK